MMLARDAAAATAGVQLIDFLFDFSITCACFYNTLGQENTRAACS